VKNDQTHFGKMADTRPGTDGEMISRDNNGTRGSVMTVKDGGLRRIVGLAERFGSRIRGARRNEHGCIDEHSGGIAAFQTRECDRV